MPQPLSIAFGPWLPDVSNQAVRLAPYQASATSVPVVDCQNVYYQDSSYRCIPAPASLGPTLGVQALNAFNWYDEVSAKEYIFAASAEGIKALIDDAWTSIALSQAIVIQGQGLSLGINLGGAIQGRGNALAITLAGGTASGQLLQGTVTLAYATDETGYDGSVGALTPSTDANGHLVSRMVVFSFGIAQPTYFIVTINATLSADYFFSVVFPDLGLTYDTTDAAFSTSSGKSTWTWQPDTLPWNIGDSGSHSVAFNA